MAGFDQRSTMETHNRKETIMFRPRIHTVCNCRAHPFPLAMRYAGQQVRGGRWVHVMYCPVSGMERHYIYVHSRFGSPILRVA
jgi:hypothetical protein